MRSFHSMGNKRAWPVTNATWQVKAEVWNKGSWRADPMDVLCSRHNSTKETKTQKASRLGLPVLESPPCFVTRLTRDDRDSGDVSREPLNALIAGGSLLKWGFGSGLPEQGKWTVRTASPSLTSLKSAGGSLSPTVEVSGLGAAREVCRASQGKDPGFLS